MGISFESKMEMLCHAASTDSKGLSMTFGHATDNMTIGAEQVLERQNDTARPSIFRAPR